MRSHKRELLKKIFSLNVFLVILLISNIVLCGFVTYQDFKTHRVYEANARKNNAKIEAADIESKRMDGLYHKYRGMEWYCIGDNLTSGHIYQGRVRDLCKFNIVVTDGHPGAGMAAMAKNLTMENLADIDLVTVFAGMYDFGKGTDLGDTNDDKTAETFYGNIEKVIDKIVDMNPNTKIVFVTPLKIGKSQYGITYPTVNQAGYELEQYVQAIKDVCNKHQIQVIDLFNEDGLEYNNLISQYSTAYDNLAEAIASELERY